MVYYFFLFNKPLIRFIIILYHDLYNILSHALDCHGGKFIQRKSVMKMMNLMIKRYKCARQCITVVNELQNGCCASAAYTFNVIRTNCVYGRSSIILLRSKNPWNGIPIYLGKWKVMYRCIMHCSFSNGEFPSCRAFPHCRYKASLPETQQATLDLSKPLFTSAALLTACR